MILAGQLLGLARDGDHWLQLGRKVTMLWKLKILPAPVSGVRKLQFFISA